MHLNAMNKDIVTTDRISMGVVCRNEEGDRGMYSFAISTQLQAKQHSVQCSAQQRAFFVNFIMFPYEREVAFRAVNFRFKMQKFQDYPEEKQKWRPALPESPDGCWSVLKRLFRGFSAVNIAGPADTSIPRGKKAKTDEGLNCTKCPMGYPKYPIFETAVQGFFCGEYCGTKHSMWE